MDLKRNFRSLIRAVSIYFKEIDLPLFWTVVAICIFSVFNLAGIVGLDSPMVIKHAVIVMVGLGVMIIVSSFNYRYLKNYSIPVITLYLGSIVLLLLTLVSPAIRGVNAWIVVGGMTFEPSEVAKLALIVLLAKYFSQRHIHIYHISH